jgi:DNA polymerase-3 subunit delta'
MLLAPDESSVLPTIASRSFIVPVRTLSVRTIADTLHSSWGAEMEQAETLAALSGGRLGHAVSLLDDKESLNRRKRALEEMSLLSGSHIADRINTATRLAKLFTDARSELYEMLDTWEGWWRDIMVVASSVPELASNIDQLPTLKSLAKKNSVYDAAAAVALIQETRKQLAENVNPRLALESLALGLP